MTATVTPPHDLTPVESVITTALSPYPKPWIGETASDAAAEVYWALVVAGMIERSGNDGMFIAKIAARLTQIQEMDDTGFSGPSAAQRLEVTLRHEEILK